MLAEVRDDSHIKRFICTGTIIRVAEHRLRLRSYMKVLVTGADGFIGSHLVESLVECGHDVRALVLYNSFNSWGWLDTLRSEILDSIEVIPSDIRDGDSMYKVVTGCAAIIHLAALIAIPYSYRSPKSYVDVNVLGTLNLLSAARHLDIQQFIHTSTSEVYGTAQYVPMDELHPLHGQSPYSASKISADQFATSFFCSYDLPVTILRPFNTYGPRQSARAIIPTIITQLNNGQHQLELGSIAPTRDFTFVKDTVAGFVAALNSTNTLGEIINLGSNMETSIYDLAKMIGDLMSVEIQISQTDTRRRPEKSEVDRLYAENQKAQSLLGWNPTYNGVSGLQRGLRNTIEWFADSSNLNLYKSDIYNI